MEHKGFTIETVEHAPGRWRAKVTRDDGSSFTHQGKANDRYETLDYPNGESATGAAKMDIDFGTIR
jgi:hypothetical protein